jgi:DNA helicase-2/ATP-dependent DNA helicase PcrA
VVSHNHSRKATKLLTQRHLRNKITCYEATDEWDEARFICQTIEQLQRDGRSLDEIAVLCRFNVQANAIEAALGNWCLPFRNVPALRFYDRSGIRDIIAYLKVLQNPLDVDSLRRILRVPVFAGDETTLMELERAAALDIVDLDKIFMNPDAANITPSLRKMLRDFNGTIDEIRAAMASLPISKLVRCVIQNTGYGAAINRDNSVIGQSMVENLGEFMVDIKNFEKHNIDAPLELFLYSVELAADYNSELTSDAMVYGTNMVTLMTLAEARGQEYSVVFIAGMEEGILPHSRSAESREALEGDRRLFYLGLTRAKERLIISHAKERSLYGYPQPYTVSRFIEEIPQGAINYTDGASCALS